MGYGEEIGRIVIPVNGDEDLLERIEGVFTEYSYSAVDVDPCWHSGTIVVSSTELNRIVAPRRELGIICRNNNIKNELAGTVASNENKFYYIDDMQTPELFALLESIDKDKTMAQYTRVLLYTISGLYQVIKSRQRTYYISAIDLYKPII